MELILAYVLVSTTLLVLISNGGIWFLEREYHQKERRFMRCVCILQTLIIEVVVCTIMIDNREDGLEIGKWLMYIFPISCLPSVARMIISAILLSYAKEG